MVAAGEDDCFQYYHCWSDDATMLNSEDDLGQCCDWTIVATPSFAVVVAAVVFVFETHATSPWKSLES